VPLNTKNKEVISQHGVMSYGAAQTNKYNTTFICLRIAIIHDTKMSEPEALREKDENNQETNDEDAVSKRKVLRCDNVLH